MIWREFWYCVRVSYQTINPYPLERSRFKEPFSIDFLRGANFRKLLSLPTNPMSGSSRKPTVRFAPVIVSLGEG